MKPIYFEHEFLFRGEPYFCVGQMFRDPAESFHLEGRTYKTSLDAQICLIERVFDRNDERVKLTLDLVNTAEASLLNEYHSYVE